jgi:hypothetical protein
LTDTREQRVAALSFTLGQLKFVDRYSVVKDSDRDDAIRALEKAVIELAHFVIAETAST